MSKAAVTEKQAMQARPPGGHLPAIDILRGIAILGVVFAHFGISGWLVPGPPQPLGAPITQDPVIHWLHGAIGGGHSASLLMIVAGISLAMMTGREHPVANGWGRVVRRIVIRSLVLLVLGLAIETLAETNGVIIVSYAFWFLVLIPFLGLSARMMFVIAGVALPVALVFQWALGGPLSEWVISPRAATAVPGVGFVGLFDAQALHAKLVFGFASAPYSTLSALPLLLFGLAVGRLDLRSTRVLRRLLVAGWALVGGSVLLSASAFTLLDPVLGGRRAIEAARDGLSPGTPWQSMLTTDPYTILGSVMLAGIATIVLVALLLRAACRVWSGDAARRSGAVSPLAAVGSLALTVYAGELLAHRLVQICLGRPDEPVPSSMLWFALAVVLILACAWLWRTRFARGPLESLVSVLSRGAGRTRPLS